MPVAREVMILEEPVILVPPVRGGDKFCVSFPFPISQGKADAVLKYLVDEWLPKGMPIEIL